MLKNAKAQTKRLSPRSSQHCLCPPNVLAGSVNSRCIGHRWLTATSVAQIQLGKKKSKIFLLSLTHYSFSIWKKKWPNMPVESISHLKRQGKCLSCVCTHSGHRIHQWILPNYPQIRKAEQELRMRFRQHAAHFGVVLATFPTAFININSFWCSG